MNLTLQISRAQGLTLGVVVAVVAGGLWWSGGQRTDAEGAARRLRLAQTQWRAVTSSEPAPTAGVAAELSRRVAAAESLVGDLRRRLGATERDPVATAEVPATRADTFFNLAQFAVAQRAAAEAAEVRVASGELFGFSAYRNSGPATEHVEYVHRQMLVLDRVLASLWAVGPEELLRVQRENPATHFPRADAGRGSREGDPGEWLVWPESRRVGRLAGGESLAVRLGWIGRTATLRAWLEQLAELDIPVVVREVGVEPVAAGRDQAGRRTLADLFREDESRQIEAEAAGGPVPLIAKNTALFWVTLEYLDVRGQAGLAPVPAEGEEEPW